VVEGSSRFAKDVRIPKAQGEHCGSKTSEGQHEGGTRDPRRDHVRIPKEIVLILGSAVAEFVADHERVPENNRACKGCSKVRSGARFMYGMGPNGEAPEAVSGASWLPGGPAGWGGRPVPLRTADLYRVNLEVKLLRTFGSVAFPSPTTKIGPKRAGFVDELLTGS